MNCKLCDGLGMVARPYDETLGFWEDCPLCIKPVKVQRPPYGLLIFFFVVIVTIFLYSMGK